VVVVMVVVVMMVVLLLGLLLMKQGFGIGPTSGIGQSISIRLRAQLVSKDGAACTRPLPVLGPGARALRSPMGGAGAMPRSPQ
jgi:hypothetical protein